MEGFDTSARSGDHSDPLVNAAIDVRKRCGAVEVYWDGDNRSADREVRKLKVIARDLPLVFPVDNDVLLERGKPYEEFLDAVVAQVREVLQGKSAAPPTS